MQLDSLRRLLIDELQEIYISETLIEDELGRMVRGADASDLKDAFAKHQQQTKVHLQRLEKVFEYLEENPRGGHGYSVKALIRESEDRMGEGGDPHVVDAALIVDAQRLEHWEMASYGGASTYAAALGKSEVADLLNQTLAEEKGMDGRLTQIADEVHVEAPKGGQ